MFGNWGKLDIAGVGILAFVILLWFFAGSSLVALPLVVSLWAMVRAIRERNKLRRGEKDVTAEGISEITAALADRIRGTGSRSTTRPAEPAPPGDARGEAREGTRRRGSDHLRRRGD